MIDFLVKLFKAFNSSQTPWQMSMAITLGMAVGLTPFSGWQSVLIITVALIINIHLGLFIVSSGFFAGLAYLFDPTFEALGYSVLTNPNLQDMFISAYNSGLMRLSYFNNTLVMGSSIVAYSLLIPIYFVLNSLVYIYRDKIASVLQKYTIFKTLGIEVSGKKDKFIRLWGFGLIAVIGAVVAAAIIIFLDPLAKSALEKGISKVAKKDVQISNVEVSLKEGELNISGLNIFKDGQSSFKADNIGVDIDFNQLLFNRYHVEKLAIMGMEFKKPTDAKVQKKKQEKKVLKSSKQSSLDFDVSSLVEPKTLVDRVGLSSSKNYEKAINQFDGIEKKYKKALDDEFSKDELKSIKAEAKKIKENLKKIKKIKKLKSEHYELISRTLDDIEKLRKKLKQKRKVLKTLKKDFKEDKNALLGFSDKVIKGASDDYEKLSKNYTFDQKGGMNVVGVLFGESIKEYLNIFLEYYEFAKPYLKSDEEEPIPPRGEGRWIKYKNLNSQVDLLVRDADISGIYEDHKFVAKINNISSDQEMLGKPVALNIKSEGKISKKIDLSLVKLESAEYKISANGYTIDYISFLADAKVNYTNTKFSSKKLNDLKSFNVDIKMGKKIYAPSIEVRSDLDKKLSDIFGKYIKEQIKKYKKELKALIDAKMQDELKKLGLKDKEIKELEKLLHGSLDDFSNTDKLLNTYEEELKSQAKERAKEKVKEKLEDEAKELFKSFKF